jgi:hypothetical protein
MSDETKPQAIPMTHLYRGAPAVRSWSKHQQTVWDWTLCGIKRTGRTNPSRCTEDEREVNCAFCLILIKRKKD